MPLRQYNGIHVESTYSSAWMTSMDLQITGNGRDFGRDLGGQLSLENDITYAATLPLLFIPNG